jgi:hypothetical protein
MVAVALMLPVAALGTEANGDRQWTVLMYFGADNDLYQATEFGMNQAIKGLEEAGADSDEIAVVVLIDGPDNRDTYVYQLDPLNPAAVDGVIDWTEAALGSSNVEKTMTDPDTLYSFLVWGMGEFDADKTMLVLKNGHAWCGICPDETDNVDNEKLLMPIEGVSSAISAAYSELYDPELDEQAWVDVVVFDGDNMGSIEVAYELRTVTSYMIGSQQQVPLEGLPYYLFMRDLADNPLLDVEAAGTMLIDNYIKYYNNTGGKAKQTYDKLLANSQMYVTAAMYEMGPDGAMIQAVVDAFNAYLKYMLDGTYPQQLVDDAIDENRITQVEIDEKHAQWYLTDADGEEFWAWIPLNRNNIASARDCALIGKINDQQGYEWLPDVYTWLWSMSALTNYEAYGDAVYIGGRPIEDVEPQPLDELVDPFVRLLLEDYMKKVGYVEPGIYRGVFDPNLIDDEGNGALVYLAQSQILDRSGNSFPHGLNIWFPPSPLQWDEDDVWSDLFNKPMTYAYSGIGVWIGIEVVMPAEYYCIDCPTMYQDIGLDFTDYTEWMDFFSVYYDSRWLIYGTDTGSKLKP